MKFVALVSVLLVLGAAADRPSPTYARPRDRSVVRASLVHERSSAVIDLKRKVAKPSLIAASGGLDAIPSSVAMLIGSAGIFFSFSVFAVLQEDVYKKAYNGEFFKSTFFCLVLERGINALVALLGVIGLGRSGLNIPHTDIFNSGVSQMLAMAASNEALRYVSYPTQVLGKSCKMVPVMAGGIVVGGKRYSTIEYVQVILITIGVCVFNFGGKSKKGGSDSPLGLALIGISLLMDAFTGGLQDKVKKRTKELNPTFPGPKRPSMHESMLWTNVSGFIVALLLAILTGHLSSGIKFCTANPACLMAIVTFSLASAMGQNFVYFTLTQFNPLVLTTVTTTRKIFSTLYSVFRSPSNSLNTMQWSGTMMVFAGLLGDVARKTMSSKPKLQAATPPPETEKNTSSNETTLQAAAPDSSTERA